MQQALEAPEQLPWPLLQMLHSVQTQEPLLGPLVRATLEAKQNNAHLLGGWSTRGHGY